MKYKIKGEISFELDIGKHELHYSLEKELKDLGKQILLSLKEDAIFDIDIEGQEEFLNYRAANKIKVKLKEIK